MVDYDAAMLRKGFEKVLFFGFTGKSGWIETCLRNFLDYIATYIT